MIKKFIDKLLGMSGGTFAVDRYLKATATPVLNLPAPSRNCGRKKSAAQPRAMYIGV